MKPVPGIQVNIGGSTRYIGSGAEFAEVFRKMDFTDYRRHWQKLVLNPDGKIPESWNEVHRTAESQAAILSAISLLWESIGFVNARRASTDAAPHNPTPAEMWKARKRWMLSHDLFIPFLSLTGHSLDQAVAALRNGERGNITEWVRRAAALRVSCGSLFIYSVDFVPCMGIYGCDIRPNMPQGFSGYEIRERQFCSKPAIEEFLRVFRSQAEDPICKEAVRIWAEADCSYNDRHICCMKKAVPVEPGRASPESLFQKLKHTSPAERPTCQAIPEKRFQEYDLWFGIERRDITRLDFALQLCDVIERILADLLLRGHRLERDVLEGLAAGMRTALVIFALWTGPIPETSPFFPRCYRGE